MGCGLSASVGSAPRCTLIASVRAVEDAFEHWRYPTTPAWYETSSPAAQMVQDHVIHFYHLHALDWVDVTLALQADPASPRCSWPS